MSSGGSIMASLKNVNSFLAVNTPLDDLIRTDFEQEGVVPKFAKSANHGVLESPQKETMLSVSRGKKENPPEQSRLGIFFSKEIFEGGLIHIHNAFVHDEGIFLKKTGHRPGYLRKVLNESSIEASMIEKATDTLDGSGMR
nr:hypothetical protein [Tanacetum cinerariifolium]